MKRYLLFHGSVYYPRGGWEDFKSGYDSVEEAREAFLSILDDWEKESIGRFVWFQVVDSQTWEIVLDEGIANSEPSIRG